MANSRGHCLFWLWRSALALCLIAIANPTSSGQSASAPGFEGALAGQPGANGSGGGVVPIVSINQLVRLSGPQLDDLYRRAAPATVPAGRVRGRAILYPGTRLAVPASGVARVMWQGKIFDPANSMAVNKFFGMRIIRGRLYYAESWLDGRQALILDYSETSRLYSPYRDEIRELAPGLYLGLMYERTQPAPTLKMYFALEAR